MAATTSSSSTATSHSPDVVFISPLQQVTNSDSFATLPQDSFPQDFFDLDLHTFQQPTSFVFQAPKATTLAQPQYHHQQQHRQHRQHRQHQPHQPHQPHQQYQQHQQGFATPLVGLSFANDGFETSMVADVREKSRNMSLSSSDQELSSDVKHLRGDADFDIDEPPRSSSNPRKRPRADSVDYPRRRATIAVRFLLALNLING
jgi:hypothetical protein